VVVDVKEKDAMPDEPEGGRKEEVVDGRTTVKCVELLVESADGLSETLVGLRVASLGSVKGGVDNIRVVNLVATTVVRGCSVVSA